MHCSSLTLEDEKRSLALLIIGFIRMVRLLKLLLFQIFLWSVNPKKRPKATILQSASSILTQLGSHSIPVPTEVVGDYFQLQINTFGALSVSGSRMWD